MFLCFLNRPTPLERSTRNTTLLCITNFNSINYDKMKAKELVKSDLFYLKLYVLDVYYSQHIGRDWRYALHATNVLSY